MSRRGYLRAWGVAGALAAAGGAAPAAGVRAQDEQAEVNEIWTAVLSNLPVNWGKWGDDDELGTLNYLGTEEILAGMEAVTDNDAESVEVFPVQLSYTGDAVTTGDPIGDPVFPTRQPARRDNVVDYRHYQDGSAEPLRGGMRFSDDAFITRLFLQGSTQYDALAHVWYERLTDDGERVPLLYNGFPAETTATKTEYETSVPGLRPPGDGDPFSTDLELVEVTETWGPSRGDVIHAAENGSVGRGVLLDVGRYKKDEPPYRLDPTECVTLEDLQDTAESQGVELRPRDTLLIRTGSIERARAGGAEFDWGAGGPEDLNEPGLCFSQDLVEWLQAMETPIIGADNLAVEKLTTQTIDVQEDINEDVREAVDFRGRDTLDVVNPLHPALITNLGMTVCEILDLSELADACANDGVYEFLYAASPLKIEHGAGAPVNPVVVKATGGGGG